jgi:hypothetical protein
MMQQQQQQQHAEYYDDVTTFHGKSLQLRRLLHCMTKAASNEITISDRLMQQQIQNAYEMLHTIELLASCIDQKYGDQITKNEIDEFNGEDYTGLIPFSATTSASLTEIGALILPLPPLSTESPMDKETRQEINDMMQYLHECVHAASQMIHEQLEARGFLQLNPDDSNSNNLINHIFFDDDDDDDNDDDDDDDDDNGKDCNLGSILESELFAEDDTDDDNNTNGNAGILHPLDTQLSPTLPKPKSKISSQQRQKQQEDMLQQEIVEMAAHLKESSLGIKSTLSAQNTDLTQMERLAQDNLDKTKDVTDKVTQQVRAGWRKSVGKWVTFFVVLGTWMFCFLTIRIVPKRKGACLLFCDGNGKGREHGHGKGPQSSYSSQSHDQGQRERQDQDGKTVPAHVNPKYSYCEKAVGNDRDAQRKCSIPLDPHHHERTMNKFGNMDAEAIAQFLTEEKRDQRMEMKLHRAGEENELVAATRVRDGWDSNNIIDTVNMYASSEEKFDDDDDEDNESHDGNMESSDAHTDVLQDEPAPVYVLGDLRDAILFKKDIVKLKDIIQQNPSLVHHRDAHGWEAIHEAVRDGNLDIVKILLNEGGANIDARVGSTGQGGSALWLAKKNRDASHPLIVYLLERGAQSIAPTQTTNKKVEL